MTPLTVPVAGRCPAHPSWKLAGRNRMANAHRR